MKRYFTIGLLLLVIVAMAQAANPDFLVLDQNKGELLRFDTALKAQPGITVGSRPSVVIDLGAAGYAVLSRGNAKTVGSDENGAILYLDRQYRPSARRINLPGIVLRDFYLKDRQLWLIITTANGKANAPATVSLINLGNAAMKTIPLKGAVTAVALKDDRSRCAITTLGNERNKIAPELTLIDLTTMTLSTFIVSTNPGAVFFRKDGRVAVICSGYRPKQRYPANVLLEEFEIPISAALHWINPENGKNVPVNLGFSPLAVTVDNRDLSTLYLISSDGPDPAEPVNSLLRITDGQIVARQKLSFEVNVLSQSSNGIICVLGKHDFRLIEPAELKVLSSYQSEMDLDELQINPTGTIAYLSASNSAYMEVLDLSAAKKIATIKLGRISISGGSFGFGLIFGDIQPAIAGTAVPVDDKRVSSPLNRRMIFTEDYTTLYVLYNSEIAVVDLKLNQIKANIKFGLGNPYGIHTTPNGRFVVVPTDSIWYFIDPKQPKPVFQLKLSDTNDAPGIGYYSPDGKSLIIPYNNQLYIIDAAGSKLTDRINAKTNQPLVTWPQ